jgi:hypothetical protein
VCLADLAPDTSDGVGIVLVNDSSPSTRYGRISSDAGALDDVDLLAGTDALADTHAVTDTDRVA